MIKAPFPWFGGKSSVARLIWSRVGIVRAYVEPFGGSLALYLAAPTPPQRPVLNDLDGLLINFWRAVQRDAFTVAMLARAPASSLELQARHNAVTVRASGLVERVASDPDFYDSTMAAYWLYARSALVGGRGIFETPIGTRVPNLIGTGVHTQTHDDLVGSLERIAAHLHYAKLLCGSWESVVCKTALYYQTPTLVFLDPPYADGEFDGGVYAHASGVWGDVVRWCLEHGDDPRLRIVLCGYGDTADLPGWSVHDWKTQGGYASAQGGERGTSNRSRECIWFSPHCPGERVQSTLF